MRFVEGLDTAPVAMAASEASAQLNDPWGALVLRKNPRFPANIDEVLAALDDASQGGAGVPVQASFFVSETGQIPLDAANAGLVREFRFVVSRTNLKKSTIVFISAPAGDREGLIELIGWDDAKRAFNYYRRLKGNEWIWRGDSRDAFRSASKGKGCFECHVHGAPIMKELRRPWNNWHSEVAAIPPEAIPTQTVREGALFRKKSEANILEPVIRAWINKTVEARVMEVMNGTTLSAAPDLVRPLFETAAANLGSSNTDSGGSASPLDLPIGFFINAEVLADVLRLNVPGPVPKIRRARYETTLAKFGFRLEGEGGCGAGNFCRKGDTHFAFFVPVPAFADVVTIRQLIAKKVVTERFATAVSMVDFPNPVFSDARRRLMRHVPASAAIQHGNSDVGERTAAAIVEAAKTSPAGSPERRFAALWALTPERLKAEAEKQIKAYTDAVRAKAGTDAGFDDYTRLAQSRRARFAVTPLAEFPLLFPKTNIPAADLHMNADGTVSP
jgi:hypothetical protein